MKTKIFFKYQKFAKVCLLEDSFVLFCFVSYILCWFSIWDIFEWLDECFNHLIKVYSQERPETNIVIEKKLTHIALYLLSALCGNSTRLAIFQTQEKQISNKHIDLHGYTSEVAHLVYLWI